MGIFESEYFKLSEPKVATPTNSALRPDELIRGDYWSVYQRDNRYILSYVSGELAGREKELEITADEASSLADKTGDVEQILISHGAN